MTLLQCYNYYVLLLGYKSWNSFMEVESPSEITYIKKKIKKIFKQLRSQNETETNVKIAIEKILQEKYWCTEDEQP